MARKTIPEIIDQLSTCYRDWIGFRAADWIRSCCDRLGEFAYRTRHRLHEREYYPLMKHRLGYGHAISDTDLPLLPESIRFGGSCASGVQVDTHERATDGRDLSKDTARAWLAQVVPLLREMPVGLVSFSRLNDSRWNWSS